LSFRGDVSAGKILATGAAGAGLSLGLLGVVEALYYAPGKPGALAYGFGLYALVGLAYGFLYSILFGGKGRRGRREFLAFAARSALVPAAGLFLVGGIFIVYRDVWKESVSRAGFWDWLIMLLIPLAAVAAGLIARKIARTIADRSFVATGSILVLAVVCLVLCGSGDEMPEIPERLTQAGTNDSRPPVFLIVGDALRADVLGCYGGDPGATPNIDEFAADAHLFRRNWSAATWTRPAVASILTGLHPANHQTIHKADRLPGGITTMAGALSSGGYATVASVTNVNLAPVFGLGRGFDVYAYHGPRPFLGAPASARRLLLVELYRLARLKFFPGHREVSRYYAPGEEISQTAREYMEPLLGVSRPFFFYLHYMEPHDPYFAHPYDGHGVARVENVNPPVEKADEFFDLYLQEVRHFDKLFGKLVEFLKEKGLYDRSLIIVTADHGEEFADHGGFWHGTTIYEELVHVPLMIRYPGGVGSGMERKELSSLVDLLPTVLDAAGVKTKDTLPGKSLLSPNSGDGRKLFAQEDHQGAVLEAVRVDDWKLIVSRVEDPRGQPDTQLFDLSVDPEEKKNLASLNPDRCEELRKLLEATKVAGPGSASVEAEKVEIDSETEEQLRSLGYTE